MCGFKLNQVFGSCPGDIYSLYRDIGHRVLVKMLRGISINKSKLEINVEGRQIKILTLVRVSQDLWKMMHI